MKVKKIVQFNVGVLNVNVYSITDVSIQHVSSSTLQ